jgi:hypothetical protein
MILKCCETCAFHRLDKTFNTPCNQFRFARCARFYDYCSVSVHHSCGKDLAGYQAAPPPIPPPPRRSLRRWFVDTFLA